MKTAIRKIGNSQGVLIPKSFLTQIGVDMGEVNIEVENGTIVIRKPAKKAREAWTESSKKIAAAGDDQLVMPEFANQGDQDLVW